MKLKRVKRSGVPPRSVSSCNFSGAVRGKYASRYAKGANVVVLDPDLARKFPSSKSVNEALRAFDRIRRLAAG